MKVKLLETFQGRDVTAVHSIDQITVSILESGEEYEVSETLGAWLVENGKAEKVTKGVGGPIDFVAVERDEVETMLPTESKEFEKPKRSRRVK